MMRTRFTWIVVSVLALAVDRGAATASDDGGSSTLLSEGLGARALGLGGAFVSVADDASATFWNAGGLGWLDRKEMQFSYRQLPGLDLHETHLGAALPYWQWGTAGLLFRQVVSSGIEGRDENNVVTDSDLTDRQSELILSYGRGLPAGLGLGGSIKWRQQRLGSQSGGALGMDLGAMLRPYETFQACPDWLSDLQLGIALRNVVEPDLQLDRESVADPLMIRVGASQRLPFGNRSLRAAIDVETARARDTRVSLGLEFDLHSALSLRTGGGSRLHAGATVRAKDLALDYSYEDHALAESNLWGLDWKFGATTGEARAAAAQEREDELHRELAETLTRNEESRFRALVAKADRAIERRSYDEAIDALGAAQVISPRRPEIASGLARAWCGRASALEASSEFGAAASAYRKALASMPGDSMAVLGERRAREASDAAAHRTEFVRQRFAAALELYSDGKLVECRSTLRELLDAEPGDTDAERLFFTTETAIAHQVEAFLDQGRTFLDAGLHADARNALRQARHLDPANVGLEHLEARLAIAEAARASQVTDAAAPTKPAPAAVRSAPSDALRGEAESLYRRGVDQFNAGRVQAAVRDWEAALQAYPQHRPSRERLRAEYVTRGLTAFSAGELDAAILAWEAAHQLDPQDERAKGYLERAREQLSRTDRLLEPNEPNR